MPAASAAPAFDETFDVVVAGYGFSGGTAAIEAADAGARVLLIEKMPDPGGISVCSYGAMRSARDAGDALRYLKATNAGRTPDEVLRVLAEGMAGITDYMRKLAAVNGAEVTTRDKVANYPFPGYETFYHTTIESVPNFDASAAYPQVRGAPGGARVFRTLEDNVADRDIEVRLETAAKRLLADGDGTVAGLLVAGPDGERAIAARRGVILACGGFEANEEMKQQYWQMRPVLSATTRGNTGDGIIMAQEFGAALWHMWHYHGSYGFRHPDYPFAIRMKRLPDWIPGREGTAAVQMTWIVVDRDGRRYMNECPPYMQDTGHRPMELFDPVTQDFSRIPSYLVCDEVGRRRYRLGAPTRNDREAAYEWSDDNMREVESGLLTRADSIAGLAGELGIDAAGLEETLERWNRCCDAGRDEDFGRPPGTMMAIRRPPFYGAPLWPVVSNTQGGPVHNADQQVIDVRGRPIPRLYAAGELGSAFGHLYLSGGNLAECLVSGRVAGRHAAGLPPLDKSTGS